MSKVREGFKLTRAERKHIEKRRQQESDKRIYRRLSALLWLDEGRTQEEVAGLLDVDTRTIRRWVKLFQKEGLDGLCVMGHEGRQCTLTPEQLESLQQEIEAGNFRNAKQARQWIEQEFGVRYSLTGTKELLHRLRATYHRTTPFLFKADPEKQKKFGPISAAETAR